MDAKRPTPRKPVLLIVDDEPDVLSSLESLLASNLPGVKVLTASSGSKGLVIARANVLDMILSDSRMDRMDGVEFLRQARVIQADIPMVVMSADAESELARHAFDLAGLTLVVPKPFAVEALVGLVQSCLGTRGEGSTPGDGSADPPPVAAFTERAVDPPAPEWAPGPMPL